ADVPRITMHLRLPAFKYAAPNSEMESMQVGGRPVRLSRTFPCSIQQRRTISALSFFSALLRTLTRSQGGPTKLCFRTKPKNGIGAKFQKKSHVVGRTSRCELCVPALQRWPWWARAVAAGSGERGHTRACTGGSARTAYSF